jgi:hypothetical protein
MEGRLKPRCAYRMPPHRHFTVGFLQVSVRRRLGDAECLVIAPATVPAEKGGRITRAARMAGLGSRACAEWAVGAGVARAGEVEAANGGRQATAGTVATVRAAAARTEVAKGGQRAVAGTVAAVRAAAATRGRRRQGSR